MSQSARLQFIIRQLGHAGGVTLKQVAERFEVSTRQAGRDIEYLRDQMHAPVVYDRAEHKYRLSSIWESYSNTDERIIIMGAYLKSLFRKIHLGPYFEQEISESLYSGISDEVRRVLDRVEYRCANVDVPDWNILSTFIDAFAQKCCVDISYTSLKGEDSQRRIEPERLINYNNTWYVYAYDHKRQADRTFHLSRIRSAVLTDRKTEHTSQKIGEGYGIYLSDRLTEYRIRFTGSAAHIVSTQIWSDSQKLERAEDGSVIMSLKSSSLEELVPAVLSFADEAEPLSPPSFVEAYDEKIRRMVKKRKKKK